MERETKFLSKRQTKRNTERYVYNLMQEFKSNQRERETNSTLDILPQSSISHSTNACLDLDQNLHLNPDVVHVSNTQQQHTDPDSDEESVHIISDISKRHDRLHNITSEILEESYEDFLTEKHSSDSEALPNNFLNVYAILFRVNMLSLSGGTTISQMTRRILERLITNNYAANYNWAGRTPKKAFKVLKTKKLSYWFVFFFIFSSVFITINIVNKIYLIILSMLLL